MDSLSSLTSLFLEQVTPPHRAAGQLIPLQPVRSFETLQVSKRPLLATLEALLVFQAAVPTFPSLGEV